MIERRKLKTADGGSAVADCLVPQVGRRRTDPDLPCARQPCLHRIFAECPPDTERILSLSGRYGLLTVSIPRTPAPGQIVKATCSRASRSRFGVRRFRRFGPAWNYGTRLRTVRSQQRGVNGLDAKSPTTWPASRSSQHFRAGFRFCPTTLNAALWQRFDRRTRRSDSPRPLRCAQLRPLVSAG